MTTLTAVQLAGHEGLPLLILGPSLGTSVSALWSDAAALLGDNFHLVGWDLPGHGRSSYDGEEFSIADLAAGVLAVADRLGQDSFAYAGVSVGGAVGQQLLIDHGDRVTYATLICTAPVLATPESWRERAALVRASGTSVMVEGSAKRWFAEGFLERSPETGAALLHSLQDTDRFGYAAVCAALAEFDVTDQLTSKSTPVLVIAGAEDEVATPEAGSRISDSVAHGRLVVLDDVAHLAPAEAPQQVADLIRVHSAASRSVADVAAAGMKVRRAVLGDAHVDRATAAATNLTREFQEFITQYAWGGIWTRPGLDRRSRSLITLTALLARGHHEEFAMHVRAARTNGLTNDEIKELILQCAIYCGVPDANVAFRIAADVLGELDQEES